MAGYAGNKFFQGKLDGKKLNDFYKLDMTKKSTAERINEVDDLLESSEFFVDYLSDIYKPNITANESTSEDTNVNKALEQMANYILNSEEEIEIRNREKPLYIFSTNKDKLNHKINREMVNMTSNDGVVKNLVDSDNIIYAQEKKLSNSRVPKTQQITTKDLKMDNRCGEILRDYKVFLDRVDKELKKKPDHLWRKYSNAKGQVKDDMINVKNMLMGVWGFNINVDESCVPDLDVFDFTDFNTVKYMLTISKPDFLMDHDMWIMWMDFIDTVNKANLTEKEIAVFLHLQKNHSLVDISNLLDVEYYSLRRTVLPNIVKKICKVGNKYDAEDPEIQKKINKRKEKAEEENKIGNKVK